MSPFSALHRSFRRLATTFVLTCGVVANGAVASAQSTIVPTVVNGTATPAQDDATLHDVCFVGKTGYAVGDRGTIWKSTDGGLTWAFVPLPPETADVSWQGVCFLTNFVGWVAGGRVRPYEQVAEGVLYVTQDGGETWESLGERLPYLKTIRMFDLESGAALAEPSRQYPSGLLQTTDGGRTWMAGNATRTVHWNAAAFVAPDAGILVGPLGERAVVARGQIVPPTLPASGLKNIHGVSADMTGRCWLVGDGALVFTSDNAGVSWQPPDASLPSGLDDFARFRAVTQHGAHVWVAGSPGSIIWHSADSGKSWEPQATSDANPVHAIRFTSESHGVAVGSLGRISVTHDGGAHWETVRGQGRRLALLSLHAHPQRISVPLIARLAGEDSYRCGISLFSRQDVGPDAHAALRQGIELQSVVQAAGGNEITCGWRLPLAVPGIARQRDRLLEDWSLLTDRRFAEVVLCELVGQIRMWRPSVLVIDEPLPDDAATLFLRQAIEAAVAQAADPTAFQVQLQSGLAPWQVEKVMLRRPLGSTGSSRLAPFDVLIRQQTMLGDASAAAAARSRVEFDDPQASHEFTLLLATRPTEHSGQSLLGDIEIPFGSAARRSQRPVQGDDYDALLAQIRQRRTITNLTASMAAHPERASMLIAQLNPLTESLPPEQAAAELARLARQYWHAGQWSLAEETYGQLLDRYPNTPVAVEAMTWLVEMWTSSELNWQRLRVMGGSKTTRDARSKEQVAQDVQQAFLVAQEDQSDTARQMRLREMQARQQQLRQQGIVPTSGDINSVLSATASNGTTSGGVSASQHSMLTRRWQESAAQVVERLHAKHPLAFEQPELQFVVASLQRRRGKHQQADAIYDGFLKTLSDDPWHMAAQGEAWLLRPRAIAPKQSISALPTSHPPVLDGVLSDACWNAATEITLGESPAPTGSNFVGDRPTGGRLELRGSRPIVLISRDAEYLYLAASVPRSPQLSADPPQLAGRTHDADLGNHDHLVFHFDVDRDYATWYEFAVDQRGWTRESCWTDKSYNPQWFVAVDGDDRTWRMEAAIPLEELVPPGILDMETWGLGVTRIMPGVGVHTWTGSGGETPNPALFGLMRFNGQAAAPSR